jgi:hypothetical protein
MRFLTVTLRDVCGADGPAARRRMPGPHTRADGVAPPTLPSERSTGLAP